MLARFNRLKVASAVSVALMVVTGCSGGGASNNTTVVPVIDDADINPWLKVQGSWVLSGAGKGLDVSSSEISFFEFNQGGCINTGDSDLAQGLVDYSLIESLQAGQLSLQASGDNVKQTYLAQALPASCDEPLAASADAKVIFDYVYHGIGQYYANFAERGIDWQQVYQRYAPRLNADSSEQQLIDVLGHMVAELEDANLVIDTGEVQLTGHKVVPLMQAAKAMAANALAYGETLSVEQALAQLQGIYLNIQKSYVTEQSWQQWPADGQIPEQAPEQLPSIAWGLSEDNVGLLVLNNLSEFSDSSQAQTLITAVMADLSDSDGIVIDMRDVSGGDADIAMVVAQAFVKTSAETHHAHIENDSHISEEVQRYRVEGNEAAYDKPVYAIVSQGTVGAAEQLALALKSQAHVKVVGESTAGAVAKPLELALPNGWKLSLPHTRVNQADGVLLSVVGISADIAAPAYTQTSTREQKFESYQRALMDLGKFEYPLVSATEYEAQMQQLMAQGLIPGAAVAVVKAGEIVYSQGFGRADDNGREVTADTPFYVASISKTILGTTMAQAEAAGLMSINDEIEGSLSFDVGYPVDSEFKPTFAHLATHTAGLSDDRSIDLCTYYFDDDYSSLANWFFAQPVCPETINPNMADHLAEYFDAQGSLYKPTHFTSGYDVLPGTVNRYSNYGAALAAQGLVAATNKSLVELTNQYVINPLAMTNTVWSADGIVVDAARRYMVNAEGVAKPLRNYRSVAYPAGGAVSTAHDLAKYMAAAMKGGVYQGEQRLAADAVAKMLTSQSDIPTTERGIGYFWRLDGDYFSHNGGDFGVLADAWADTHHDIAVVLLTNGDVLHSPAIGSMINMFAASKAFAYGLQD